jgi:flavin prenyltransferase
MTCSAASTGCPSNASSQLRRPGTDMRPQGTSRSTGNRRRLLADDSGERARLVVGIAGASGIIYGVRLLELLAKVKAVETHLIVTPNAKRTLGYELDMSAEELGKLGDVSYRYHDMGAALSSGSFSTSGMIIAPCSVKTLSGIVNCYDDNLLVRAADVTLKERRPLVLLFRETPLHVGHLRMLGHAAEMGAIPGPVPSRKWLIIPLRGLSTSSGSGSRHRAGKSWRIRDQRNPCARIYQARARTGAAPARA